MSRGKFCNWLKKFRKEKDITQRETARVLGVSTPRISEWERGTRKPKPLTREGIEARLIEKYGE